MAIKFKWYSTKTAIMLHCLIALFAWVPWLVSAFGYIGGFPSLAVLYIVLTLYGVTVSILGVVQRRRTIKRMVSNNQTKKPNTSLALTWLVTLNAIITIGAPVALIAHGIYRTNKFELEERERLREWKQKAKEIESELKVLENKIHAMDSLQLIDFISAENLDYCTINDITWDRRIDFHSSCENDHFIHLHDSTNIKSLKSQIMVDKTMLLDEECVWCLNTKWFRTYKWE